MRKLGLGLCPKPRNIFGQMKERCAENGTYAIPTEYRRNTDVAFGVLTFQ